MVAVCLIAVGIAIKVAAAHYGDTHPDAVILALIGLIIGAVCVALCEHVSEMTDEAVASIGRLERRLSRATVLAPASQPGGLQESVR